MDEELMGVLGSREKSLVAVLVYFPADERIAGFLGLYLLGVA